LRPMTLAVRIERKKLRRAELFDLISALPLAMYRIPELHDYDGEYLRLHNPPGEFHVCGWTFGIRLDRLNWELNVTAVGYAPDDTKIFWMFLEPRKGDYANFQGIRHTGYAYVVESRKGGVESETDIGPQDFTKDTEFRLSHRSGYFAAYINGALVAEHTTNISDQPYEAMFGEPDEVERVVYLRYPRGIAIRW